MPTIFAFKLRRQLLCIVIFVNILIPAKAQWFSTPQVLNGNPSEVSYKKDEFNSRLYIGWDDTYLYLAKKEFSTRPVVIYFDLDPYFPVSGGGPANGNLTGVTHYNHTMDLPFRWDMALYWVSTGAGTSYIEYKERNGSGGYTTQIESAGILEDALYTGGSINYAECRIKWSEINGSGGGRPASFNWYGYQFLPNSTATQDYVDQPMPYELPGVNNPFGNISGNTKVYFYQTVPTTNAAGISDAISLSLRSFETRGDFAYTSSNLSPVYDMTVFKESGSDENLRIMSNVTVTNNLAISGGFAGLRSDGDNYTITLSGTNGIMHISDGAEMYGEFGGNLLYVTFNGYTTLQQIGGNTFDARIVTVIADKTLNANTASISSVSVTGPATGIIYGTVITTNLSGFSGNLLSTFRNGFTLWDMGANSLIHYADPTLGTQTLTPRTDYGNVTISGGGIKSFSSETGNVALSGTLTFTDGMIYTGANKVIVKNPSETAIMGYDNTQYINGTLTRNVISSGNYTFPVGDASQYELAIIDINSSSGLDSITANFNTLAPSDPAGLNATGSVCDTETTPIEYFLNYGYWTINPSPLSPTIDYDITLTSRGHTNAAALVENHGIFKNPTLISTTWEEVGEMYDADCLIDITVGGSSSPVTVTHIGATTFSNFAIGLNTEFILPITLAEFTGWYNGNSNELHWKTFSEVNADYFEIEKSPDANAFSMIGIVDASDNSSTLNAYAFYDDNPLPGLQYYRLRMVDMDGSFEYSNIIAIDVDGSIIADISIYPNPVKDKLNAEIISTSDIVVNLKVFDILGNTLINFPQQLHTGKNKIYINTNTLARGSYLFTITAQNSGEITSKVFVK